MQLFMSVSEYYMEGEKGKTSYSGQKKSFKHCGKKIKSFTHWEKKFLSKFGSKVIGVVNFSGICSLIVTSSVQMILNRQ